jgi:hypothetical protein
MRPPRVSRARGTAAVRPPSTRKDPSNDAQSGVLDVAAAAIGFYGAEPFGTFCAALADQTSDELKLAGEPADTLPTAQQSSVAATLLRSIERLAEEGKDLLRLACLVAAAPIPHWLVETVFASADGLEA